MHPYFDAAGRHDGPQHRRLGGILPRAVIHEPVGEVLLLRGRRAGKFDGRRQGRGIADQGQVRVGKIPVIS